MKLLRCTVLGAALMFASGGVAQQLEPSVRAASDIEAGRYLVMVAGCNDCHTPGYMETAGGTAESEWLTGVPIGWRGPWGTTYASNLRLLVKDMTEDDWVQTLRHRTARPPMPWMNVNRMSEPDARAIYRFVRSLGPAGVAMPAAVAPDVEPSTPYYLLDPQGGDRLQSGMESGGLLPPCC